MGAWNSGMFPCNSMRRGPGVLVVVTHQVTITGLSGIHPASGEGVALRWVDGRAEVLGRLDAPAP